MPDFTLPSNVMQASSFGVIVVGTTTLDADTGEERDGLEYMLVVGSPYGESLGVLVEPHQLRGIFEDLLGTPLFDQAESVADSSRLQPFSLQPDGLQLHIPVSFVEGSVPDPPEEGTDAHQP